MLAGEVTGIIIASVLLLTIVAGIALYTSYCTWRGSNDEEKTRHKLNKLFSAVCGPGKQAGRPVTPDTLTVQVQNETEVSTVNQSMSSSSQTELVTMDQTGLSSLQVETGWLQ